MNKLTIIVHTEDQQEVVNRPLKIEQISGFTVIRIEGHGIEPEHNPLLSARYKLVGSSPHRYTQIMLDTARDM